MHWPLLVTTATMRLLTPDMIAEFLAKAEGADVAIGLVSSDAHAEALAAGAADLAEISRRRL